MVEALSGRATTQQELTTIVDGLLASWDTLPTVLDTPATHYIAKQAVGDDGVSTLIKFRCDGLTEAHMTKFIEDPMVVARALNPKMTPEYLADDEGCKVVHIKMKMPMLISNRSIITCIYRYTKEDGTNVLMHSSRGNEAIATARASSIGKDVMASILYSL